MTTVSTPVAKVSVIVPCRNEERFIERCLDSILAGDYPRDALEVLVVDGRSDDRTRAILNDYASRNPIVRVLDNPGRIQAAALNIGIRAARGEILVRMDAHVVYPRNYIVELVSALVTSGADNVGCVLVTLPANQTPTAQAIAIAMSHPFGVGNSHFRIGVKEPRWVDTVAFFCCRRETFSRVGLFDEHVRDEDSEFNARLIEHGGRILLVPNVVCYYYARDSFRQVSRMSFQYGYSKPLMARKLRRVVTARQLIPPGFVLALLATALLTPLLPAAGWLFGATLATYMVAALKFSFSTWRKAGIRAGSALALVFPVLHISYGLGFWKCVLELAVGFTPRVPQAEVPLSR